MDGRKKKSVGRSLRSFVTKNHPNRSYPRPLLATPRIAEGASGGGGVGGNAGRMHLCICVLCVAPDFIASSVAALASTVGIAANAFALTATVDIAASAVTNDLRINSSTSI